MKIVRLSDGLGNAMFQYCNYLKLKKLYSKEKIYVDTSFYRLTDYPNELPEVLGNSLVNYDISEDFIKDKDYLEGLDKLKYWKKLGVSSYWELVRGKNEKEFVKLDAKMSYIELPLLYKKKYNDLKIISPNDAKMDNILEQFLEDEHFLNDSKYITFRHYIAEFINNRLKGTTKLKFNLLRVPDVRGRLFKQLLNFERPDWCHFGNIEFKSTFDNTYYNIYGAPCSAFGIENEVRNAFKFTPFAEDYNVKMAKRIMETEAVAIHARVVNFEYGMKTILERDYYKKAIKYIKKNINNHLSFYIFSDNVSWCKDNLDKLGLKDEDITFIDYNRGENTYRDMQLMSLCKHIVISHSTFSWWGGFLISNPEKIFITPYGTWPGTISF